MVSWRVALGLAVLAGMPALAGCVDEAPDVAYAEASAPSVFGVVVRLDDTTARLDGLTVGETALVQEVLRMLAHAGPWTAAPVGPSATGAFLEGSESISLHVRADRPLHMPEGHALPAGGPATQLHVLLSLDGRALPGDVLACSDRCFAAWLGQDTAPLRELARETPGLVASGQAMRPG